MQSSAFAAAALPHTHTPPLVASRKRKTAARGSDAGAHADAQQRPHALAPAAKRRPSSPCRRPSTSSPASSAALRSPPVHPALAPPPPQPQPPPPPRHAAEEEDEGREVQVKETNGEEEEPLRVFLRIRPLLPDELARGEHSCLVQRGRASVSVVPAPATTAAPAATRTYHFDGVFGPDAGQEAVFEQAVGPLVEGVLRAGRPALVFASGTTNSGKTHSITGGTDSAAAAGILPRAFARLLLSQPPQPKAQPHQPDPPRGVALSALEIYRERPRDLLLARSPAAAASPAASPAAGAHPTERVLCTAEDLREALAEIRARRHVGDNTLNRTSTRGHVVFTLRPLAAASGAHLAVVDLAGSERNSRTGAAGDALREASSINASLTTLGRCIDTLRRNRRHPRQPPLLVPFRDSRLTEHFRTFFAGAGGRGVLLVCVSPAVAGLSETVGALDFGAKAQDVVLASPAGTTPRGGNGAGIPRSLAAAHAERARAQEELAALRAVHATAERANKARIAALERELEQTRAQLRAQQQQQDAHLPRAPLFASPPAVAGACADPTCGAVFSLMRRPHECRVCSAVFCWRHFEPAGDRCLECARMPMSPARASGKENADQGGHSAAPDCDPTAGPAAPRGRAGCCTPERSALEELLLRRYGFSRMPGRAPTMTMTTPTPMPLTPAMSPQKQQQQQQQQGRHGPQPRAAWSLERLLWHRGEAT